MFGSTGDVVHIIDGRGSRQAKSCRGVYRKRNGFRHTPTWYDQTSSLCGRGGTR